MKIAFSYILVLVVQVWLVFGQSGDGQHLDPPHNPSPPPLIHSDKSHEFHKYTPTETEMCENYIILPCFAPEALDYIRVAYGRDWQKKLMEKIANDELRVVCDKLANIYDCVTENVPTYCNIKYENTEEERVMAEAEDTLVSLYTYVCDEDESYNAFNALKKCLFNDEKVVGLKNAMRTNCRRTDYSRFASGEYTDADMCEMAEIEKFDCKISELGKIFGEDAEEAVQLLYEVAFEVIFKCVGSSDATSGGTNVGSRQKQPDIILYNPLLPENRTRAIGALASLVRRTLQTRGDSDDSLKVLDDILDALEEVYLNGHHKFSLKRIVSKLR